MQQRQKVMPLQQRSILEFINEIMLVFLSYSLIDERHAATSDNVGYSLVKFRNMNLVGIVHKLTNHSQQSSTKDVEIQIFTNYICKEIRLLFFYDIFIIINEFNLICITDIRPFLSGKPFLSLVKNTGNRLVVKILRSDVNALFNFIYKF